MNVHGGNGGLLSLLQICKQTPQKRPGAQQQLGQRQLNKPAGSLFGVEYEGDTQLSQVSVPFLLCSVTQRCFHKLKPWVSEKHTFRLTCCKS